MSESVRLHAKKTESASHMSWQAELIIVTDEWIAVDIPKGTEIAHHTRGIDYAMAERNIGLLSTRQYFNIFSSYNTDGDFSYMYINVATPAQLIEGEVSWVDLELDVTVNKAGEVTLIDQDEFDEAVAAGNHDPVTIERASKMAAYLLTNAGDDKYPFMRSSYDDTMAAILNAR